MEIEASAALRGKYLPRTFPHVGFFHVLSSFSPSALLRCIPLSRKILAHCAFLCVGQLLDRRLAPERQRPIFQLLRIPQAYRPPGLGVFRALSSVMRRKTPRQVVCHPGIQRPVGAFQDVNIPLLRRVCLPLCRARLPRQDSFFPLHKHPSVTKKTPDRSGVLQKAIVI